MNINTSILLKAGVKAIIKNSSAKYLLLLRAKPYPGNDKCKWDIPGMRAYA